MRQLAIAILSLSALAAAGADILGVAPQDGNTLTVHTAWGDFNTSTDDLDAQDRPPNSKADETIRVHLTSNGRVGAQLVDVQTYSTSKRLDDVVLYQVGTEILFNAKPLKAWKRPAKLAGTEYTSIYWLQRGKGTVRAALAIDGKVINPVTCPYDEFMSHCEFVVPRPLLVRPGQYVLYEVGKQPAVLQFETLVKRAYADMMFETDWPDKFVRSGSPAPAARFSKEQIADLDAMHQLDPSITVAPEYVKAAKESSDSICPTGDHARVYLEGKGKKRTKVTQCYTPTGEEDGASSEPA